MRRSCYPQPRPAQGDRVSNSTVNGPSFTRSTSISAPKTPRPTRTPAPSSCVANVLHQLRGSAGFRSAEERRAPTLSRVGEQRELRHDERLSADGGEVVVRLAVGVPEDPQARDLVGEPFGVGLGVVVAHPHQEEVPESDRGNLGPVDRDGGAADPLEHHPH